MSKFIDVNGTLINTNEVMFLQRITQKNDKDEDVYCVMIELSEQFRIAGMKKLTISFDTEDLAKNYMVDLKLKLC
jgi:hypothetical protein